MAYLAAQGRRLVQATSRGPGDSVLRFDADAGQSRPGRVIAQQAQVKQVGCGCGNGTLEGRRAGEPRALGYLAIDHEVKATDLVAALLKCPENTGGVTAPAGRITGPHVVELEVVRARRLHRCHPQPAVAARPDGGICALW